MRPATLNDTERKKIKMVNLLNKVSEFSWVTGSCFLEKDITVEKKGKKKTKQKHLEVQTVLLVSKCIDKATKLQKKKLEV